MSWSEFWNKPEISYGAMLVLAGCIWAEGQWAAWQRACMEERGKRNTWGSSPSELGKEEGRMTKE
jgi:hypothetical protein